MAATRPVESHPGLNGPSQPGRAEPLADALDHLLDPLDFTSSSAAGAAGDVDASRSRPGWGAVRPPGGTSDALAAFSSKLRRSRRPRYRIPRLMVAWTLFAAAVCGLVLVLFTLAGPR